MNTFPLEYSVYLVLGESQNNLVFSSSGLSREGSVTLDLSKLWDGLS